MSESKVRAAFHKHLKLAFKDASVKMTEEILNAFDNEFGYDEDGNRVDWDELSEDYISNSPPRGRGGSSGPILNFEGDLRSAIRVKAIGYVLDSDVTSQKPKLRGKGDTITLQQVSEYNSDRPHTNTSKAWLVSTPNNNMGIMIRRAIRNAVDELRKSGDWIKE